MSPEEAYNQTFKEIDGKALDLSLDSEWPRIARQYADPLPLADQISYWSLVEREFVKREGGGHFHKGEIYWRKGLAEFSSDQIKLAITSLEKAVAEDKILRPNHQAAAETMLSILKPIFYSYIERTHTYALNEETLNFYEGLPKDEKDALKDAIFTIFDSAISGQIHLINPNFYHFLDDDTKQEVFKLSYEEAAAILRSGVVNTTFSCVYTLGSIAELMIDDLFLRNSEEIWQIFKNSAASQSVDPKSKMNSTKYDDGMTLGQKIMVLQLLATKNISPIPPYALLQLRLIGTYRDLIHPRRQQKLPFQPTQIIGIILFSTIASIASHWWPENIEKRKPETK